MRGGEGGKEGVDREGEVDEAGSRESSNDQRTTCRTLKVISCFIDKL